MRIQLSAISGRRGGVAGPPGELVRVYVGRAARYMPVEVLPFASEAALLETLGKAGGRTRPVLWLLESTGKPWSSEEMAENLGRCMDGGAQRLVMAVGPADGWSRAALAAADSVISFGRITLPHELAAVVAAEQIYRALTIRAGHPYHSGH